MAEKDSYIVEGYWDCSSCGAKGIRGRFRDCPNCGKPRGEDVEFYLKEYGREYAIDDSDDRPDWFCEYCSSYNPAAAEECLSCGAAKGDKTYSQMRDTTTSSRIQDADANGIDDSGEVSDEERDKQYWERRRRDRERQYGRQSTAAPTPNAAATPDTNSKMKKRVFGAVGVLALIGLLIWFFMPKSVDMVVSGVSWERHIQIHQFQTVSESDWSVPNGGRVYDQRREIHHYDHILDHYEDYYETVTEQVIDHYKTVKSKRDLGNGKFEITEEKEPVYKTVSRKEKRQRPVYVDVPVYSTKYYYELERWRNNRSVDTSGSDKKPYFGEVTLAKGQPPYNVGEEKESGRSSTYKVTGVVDDEEKTFVVDDESWWNSMSVGDTIHGKVTFDDHLEKEE